MQSHDGHSNKDHEGLSSPPKLVAAFREFPLQQIFVPPAVDQAILTAARRKLTPPARRDRRWWRIAPWLAAAAAAIVGLLIVLSQWDHRGPSPTQVLVHEDLNRDGTIDILDAFSLAKQLEEGNAAANTDFNLDGTLDSKDVFDLAARVVSVGRSQL